MRTSSIGFVPSVSFLVRAYNLCPIGPLEPRTNRCKAGKFTVVVANLQNACIKKSPAFLLGENFLRRQWRHFTKSLGGSTLPLLFPSLSSFLPPSFFPSSLPFTLSYFFLSCPPLHLEVALLNPARGSDVLLGWLVDPWYRVVSCSAAVVPAAVRRLSRTVAATRS